MKIFDNKTPEKTAKIITLIFLGVLFLWFTFNLTGLEVGNIKIVASCFIDEPIDFVFWLLFLGCQILFVLKDKIGKYAMTVFLILWAVIQYSIYFRTKEGIANYNNSFAGTHHIINASENFLIKDTYHIFLDIFIAFALLSIVIFSVLVGIGRVRQKGLREAQ